jgi:hypothetical protein
MIWLLAAYGTVIVALVLYGARLSRMRRALEAEINATTRPR